MDVVYFQISSPISPFFLYIESKILFNPFLINLFEIALMAGQRTHGQTKRAFCRVKFVGFVILLFAIVLNSFNVAPINNSTTPLFTCARLAGKCSYLFRDYDSSSCGVAKSKNYVNKQNIEHVLLSTLLQQDLIIYFVLTFSQPMQCNNQIHQQKLKHLFFD